MSVALYLIAPPTEDVVSLDEAKSFLRLTDDDNDALVSAMISAAVGAIDPASNGWLGRALRPQTWELRMPGFHLNPYIFSSFYHYMMEPEFYHRRRGVNTRRLSEIELPYPPLISVDSIKYDDSAGVEQTLTAQTDYRVFGIGSAQKAHVAPPYNSTWPFTARFDDEAVRIRFTSGYSSASGDAMPGAIKQAVLLMVKALYDLTARNLFVSGETVEGVGSRSFVVTSNSADVMRSASENLLQTLRVYE